MATVERSLARRLRDALPAAGLLALLLAGSGCVHWFAHRYATLALPEGTSAILPGSDVRVHVVRIEQTDAGPVAELEFWDPRLRRLRRFRAESGARLPAFGEEWDFTQVRAVTRTDVRLFMVDRAE